MRRTLLTRREALRVLALGLGGLYVSACSPTASAPQASSPAPAATPASARPTAAAQAASTATAAGAQLAGSEVRLGALVPSTGPNAEWGRKNTVAVKLAEEEINAAGGVGGVPLKVIVYDTGQKPDQAANLVRKLAQDDQVLAIAGPLFSSECEVAFPVANQMKIVCMSQASSKPGVAAANRPYAFRNTMDEAKMARLTVPKFIKAFNVKKPAVIYDIKDATSSTLGKTVLPEQFKAEGVPVINTNDPVTFQSGDTDLSAQVTKLKGLGADALLMGADFGPASNVLREMNRQGLLIPVIGGSPLISVTILQAAGKVPIVAPATFYVGEPRPKAEAFVKKFRERATEIPEATRDPVMYDANIYDAIYIFVQAIKEGGVTNKPEDLAADRERIMKYLSTLKNFDGVGGKISFDQNGDGDKEVFVVTVKDGKWVELA